VRAVAQSYPYDSHADSEEALSTHTAEVSKSLQVAIQERLAKAGVEVIEARISHLAYSPEIAQAMLQRQQATAIIAARFKIVEAWAAGIPVVSTTVGAEGLPAGDGENILLADNGPAFAETVSKLLASPVLRERIGSAGRRLQERDFTWDSAWRSLRI